MDLEDEFRLALQIEAKRFQEVIKRLAGIIISNFSCDFAVNDYDLEYADHNCSHWGNDPYVALIRTQP